jgi:hypothetical protein
VLRDPPGVLTAIDLSPCPVLFLVDVNNIGPTRSSPWNCYLILCFNSLILTKVRFLIIEFLMGDSKRDIDILARGRRRKRVSTRVHKQHICQSTSPRGCIRHDYILARHRRGGRERV